MKNSKNTTTNDLFTLENIKTESGKSAIALIPNDRTKKLNAESFNKLRNLILSENGFSFGKYLPEYEMRPICIMKLTELQIERLLEGFNSDNLETITKKEPKNKGEKSTKKLPKKEVLKAKIEETKKPAQTTKQSDDKSAQITALRDLHKEGIITKEELIDLIKGLK